MVLSAVDFPGQFPVRGLFLETSRRTTCRKIAYIFYSWQSDLANSTNRGFIEDCLKKAVKNLKKEGVNVSILLSRWTPPIFL